MDRSRRKSLTWLSVGLTALIVLLMLWSNLRRSSRVVLPAAVGSASGLPVPLPGEEDVTVVTITPENVRAAVADLRRPSRCRRSVTVEYLWPGGSATQDLTVWVLSGWTRVDRTLPDGQVRHSVTNGEQTHIWYNEEKEVYTAAAGAVTADNEQLMPTYEAVLALTEDQIAQADYRMISDVRCIYVETVPDAAGRAMRYWISVDTGLLAVAEQLEGGEAVYRMASLTVDAAAPEPSDFVLPDGRALLSLEAAAPEEQPLSQAPR